ncbi:MULTISPECIES: hypothetical protein [Staphylococcus]|uniref:Uncharacterized protein n=1 Tax=Staphylococcus gallinarum TaxID=1293 RepID=A0A418HPK8_STAGA|nr:hypothetical protein [Staphylococcus gallinarum]MCD8827537.1 hypothetical protein [Staphylococcus gallinarum]PTE73310.1 hypothetical protein BUY96_13145 [Staphylococcus gallinarum]RIL43617.1 hypothetical protein BUZ01_03080 [Staphylococcus gallinarum]RIO89853.1 hypothetical protein BUZ04_11860 [Staphylococcus gallinarum]
MDRNSDNYLRKITDNKNEKITKIYPRVLAPFLGSKVLGKNGNTININNKAITTEQDENKYRIILLTSNQNSYEHEKIEK